MEKIVEFNNIQTLAALASVKLAGSKILFIFKYYFLLTEFKLHEAPTYTCSLQDNWQEILQTKPKQFTLGPHHKQSHI